MAMENIKDFERYNLFNIPKEIEYKWKSEMIEKISSKLGNKTFSVDIWKNIVKMCELVDSTKSIIDLSLIYHCIKDNFMFFTSQDKMLVSEAIIGRKHTSQRSGLIYLSYDIGNIELAKNFALLCLELSDIECNEYDIKIRLEESKKMCINIIEELFLF